MIKKLLVEIRIGLERGITLSQFAELSKYFSERKDGFLDVVGRYSGKRPAVPMISFPALVSLHHGQNKEFVIVGEIEGICHKETMATINIIKNDIVKILHSGLSEKYLKSQKIDSSFRVLFTR